MRPSSRGWSLAAGALVALASGVAVGAEGARAHEPMAVAQADLPARKQPVKGSHGMSERELLQNPLVQQMLRNPELQQQIMDDPRFESLTQDPQVQRLMQNPQVQRQMQQNQQLQQMYQLQHRPLPGVGADDDD